MRIGCHVPFSGSDEDATALERLAAIGYRFIEPSVEVLRVHGEPSEYFAMRRALNRAPLNPEAFCWWHPPELHLIGDHADWSATERYLALVLERIEELDGLVLSVSSGYCRGFPLDYPPEDALSQVRYFLNMAADYAGDVTIAVGRIFCDLPQAAHLPSPAELVRELGRPQVALLAQPSAASEGDGWPADCAHLHLSAQWLCGLPEEAAGGVRECAGKCPAQRASVVLDATAEDILATAEGAARVLGLAAKA